MSGSNESSTRRIELTTYDELVDILEARDIRFVKAIVETVLENLDTEEERLTFLEAFIEDEDTVFEFSLGKENYKNLLEENLESLAEAEEYELCVQVQKVLMERYNEKED